MNDLQYQYILQFLEGTLDDDAQASLKEWREKSPENEAAFEETKFLWQQAKLTQSVASTTKIDVEAALKKVHPQLTSSAKLVDLRKRRFTRIAAVAASVAALFLLGLFWLVSPTNSELLVIRTAENEQKKFTLPDESTVWLNENSELYYPEIFPKNNRAVTMKGDIVFEVTPNKQKPFIVKSDLLAVQVLGTKFNVITSNFEDLKSYVHVLHGKVKVQRADLSGNQIILEKGKSASLSEKDMLTLSEEFSANRLFWLNQKMAFDRRPLNAVFSDLEYVFKVKLEIENPKILDCPFSGKFDDSVTVEELLEMMTTIFGIEIEKIDAAHYKIKKGNC